MKCNLCGRTKWYQKGRLLICGNCTLGRAEDRYFRYSAQKIYSPAYFKGGDYYNYRLEKPALSRNFGSRLQLIRRYCPAGKLLEIGCAYGYFLNLAKHHFDAFGVEVDPRIANIAHTNSKAKIYPGDFLSVKIDATFDVIVALDVIEHLKDPGRFLSKCYRLLKTGGYLFLETGDIGGWLPMVQQDGWRLIHPPEHLFYFSKRTLSQMLLKHHFKRIDIKTVTQWRTIGQTLFRLNPKIFNPANPLIRCFGLLVYPVNTGDIMMVVGRK